MTSFNVFASAELTQVIGESTLFPSGDVLDLCLALDLDTEFDLLDIIHNENRSTVVNNTHLISGELQNE